MIVYITPAGKTAALVKDFLSDPKKIFNFDIAIILTSTPLIGEIAVKTTNYSCIIEEITSPFSGDEDYECSVRKLISDALLYSDEISEIIVNSSGGTEKMSSIIKDVAEILSVSYNTRHVFGMHNRVTGELIFSTCPQLDREKILRECTEYAKQIKESKDTASASNLDEYKE